MICYAESDDGIRWVKDARNPVFACAPENIYEQNRIGTVQVLPEDGSLHRLLRYTHWKKQ